MKNEITLSEIINAGGSKSYRVYGIVNGKMHRRQFVEEKHAEAITFKQNLEREQANLQPLPAITTRLNDEQAREAEHVFRLIDGKSYTLTQAVSFALANYAPSVKPISAAKAVELFLTQKGKENLRPRTIGNLRARLAMLTREHANLCLGNLTRDLVRAVIQRAGHGPRTQRNNALVLSNFFNWAKDEEYIAASPMEKITLPKIDEREPEIFTVDECAQLVATARDFQNGRALAYIALALFCGIRPKECERLTWDNIDFRSNVVELGAKVSKVRGRRLVDIPSNAAHLLRLAHAMQHPIRIPDKVLPALRIAAGLTRWPDDVLRHTGVSMRLEKTGDENATAKWAGNSPTIIHKHYKGLVRSGSVDAFYSIGSPVLPLLHVLPASQTAPAPAQTPTDTVPAIG